MLNQLLSLSAIAMHIMYLGWVLFLMQNLMGVAVLNLSTVTCCGQFVGQPAYIHRIVLDLVFSYNQADVDLRVSAPIGSPNHSSLILDIQLDQRESVV